MDKPDKHFSLRIGVFGFTFLHYFDLQTGGFGRTPTKPAVSSLLTPTTITGLRLSEGLGVHRAAMAHTGSGRLNSDEKDLP